MGSGTIHIPLARKPLFYYPKTLLLVLLFLCALSPVQSSGQSDSAKGKAERIAKKVMEASGGEKRWEEVHYLHWNFFGTRDLWWDKQEHRVRIEWPDKKLTLIADLEEDTGEAWKGEEPVKDSSKQERLISTAEKIWANDSYWLFMPFKMLDPGVNLEYLGTDSLASGPAHLLKMTFEEVGFTPRNKYHIWVDKEEHLVRRWAYFKDRDEKAPSLVTPWDGYASYNGLRLSSDRGDRKIKDIAVAEDLPKGTFSKKKLSH